MSSEVDKLEEAWTAAAEEAFEKSQPKTALPRRERKSQANKEGISSLLITQTPADSCVTFKGGEDAGTWLLEEANLRGSAAKMVGKAFLSLS